MPGERSLLIDPVRCVGCKSCLAVCSVWNSLPISGGGERKGNTLSPSRWISVQHNYNENIRTIMMCLHCEDAPCIGVCPQKAISIHNGWVVIDRDKCIGCNACVSVCPYGAVKRHSIKGAKAVKCDGCMSSYSEAPRCTEVCPTGALKYGYRGALIKEGLARASEYGMRLFGREEYGSQNVLRIGTRENYTYRRNKDNIYNIKAVSKLHGMLSKSPFAGLFPQEVHSLAKMIVGFFNKSV